MSVNEIRFSIETRKFFYENEMNFANEMLICQNYTHYSNIIYTCIDVQEKKQHKIIHIHVVHSCNVGKTKQIQNIKNYHHKTF
jgi:uncharacterized membrane protein